MYEHRRAARQSFVTCRLFIQLTTSHLRAYIFPVGERASRRRNDEIIFDLEQCARAREELRARRRVPDSRRRVN